jgi:hypothetical protein
MKRFAPKKMSFLYSAWLIAGVLLNLCVAPAASFGHNQSQRATAAFATASGGVPSHALTTGLRGHSEVPASKQKRSRHPALDFTALPPESFTLASLSLGQHAFDNDLVVFHSAFSVRPKGRAPPVSV